MSGEGRRVVTFSRSWVWKRHQSRSGWHMVSHPRLPLWHHNAIHSESYPPRRADGAIG